MFRLPFLTLTVTMLLMAVYSVTGSRALSIEEELARVHRRHGIEPKVAVLLAQACARRNPADSNCIGKAERAARAVLNEGPRIFPLEADERALVEDFRNSPLGIYELPGYAPFASAWEEERVDLARLAREEGILLGRHWSWSPAFWSLWEHGSLAHLVFNVINLVLFGVLVEWLAGKRAWTAAYFGSGIVATAAFSGFFPHELSVTLGASPAIYGLMGLYMAYLVEDLPLVRGESPRRKVIFYGAALYAGLDLATQGLVLGSDVFPLHFTGFLAGLSLGILFRACALARPAAPPQTYAVEPGPYSRAS
jgi:membrane associated rhomboid family serine protease